MKPWTKLPPVAIRALSPIAFIPLLTFVAIASLATAAHALLLAEERFLTSGSPSGPEYTVGAIAGQNPSSIGFSGAWFTSTGTSPTVDAATLNYSDANFPAETGGKMLVSNNNSRVHRLMAASNPFESTDSGTVYLSFLLQTGTNNGYRAFEMHNGGNADAANRTLQIGLHNGGDFPLPDNFGFRVNNNSSLEFTLGAENSNANLFLVKFILSTTNNADTITVWNNPSLASLASDPSGGVMASGFNFAADRLGVGRFTGTAPGFDELRVGTTLQDVLANSLLCDVNGNSVCNSSDIAIISQNMYLTGNYQDGDVDGSGTIDFADYRLFKDHPARVVGFDAPGGGAGAIPEPTSAQLVALAGLVCCGCGLWGRRLRALRSGFAGCLALVFLATILSGAPPVQAADQDLLGDTIGFSGKTLNLRPYTTLPAGFNDIISMTTRPDDTRLYVTAQEGTIFAVNDNGNGTTTPVAWFDAASALTTATGRTMNGVDGQRGLQSVAYHPDFANVASPGYGKLYTTMLENRPANPGDPAFFYIGNSTYGGGGGDGVLAEWTYNHGTGQVDANSYRELFRVNMPNFDHPIKQAKFNQYATPGDDDYGLLYMTQGDSNNQDSLNDDPQDRGDVLGKIIRINPLQSGGNRYTIPTTNPFYNDPDPNVLEEVYAYGFRNPHTFSFNEDDEGNVHILVGDIGRSNMEEINLVVAGGNYGWTKREGTFVHLQGSTYPPNPSPDAGYIYGVAPLAANEATIGVGPDGNRFIYPVAQYDHNGAAVTLGQDFTATSIASGFVVRNGSDPALHDQLVFLNFSFNHGDVYHTDFDAMRNAVTQLDPNDPSRDEPTELTQADLQRLHLTLDHDNNPLTPAQTSDSINSLLGVFRNDSRFGEGLAGEMYISNKNNNIVYLVTNTIPGLRLTVDRGTGEMSITNPTRADVDINSVTVSSPSGSLVPGQFQSLAGGWSSSPANSPNNLSQADASGSLVFTNATTGILGNAYEAQLVTFGGTPGEDLQFQYALAGGGTATGYVNYTGVSTVVNTIVLTVDVASGQASMLNQTPFSQEVEFYTISSTDGSLNATGWNSLDAQGIEGGDWIASPALSTRITELQEDGTTTFDDLTPFGLGEILQASAEQDLVFEFLLAGEGALRQGKVVYILAGDYNGDDLVDAADYTAWRDSLNSTNTLPNDMTPGSVTMADYTVWKNNFGAVLPGAGGGSGLASVPEPGALILIGSVALCFLATRRERLDF